MASSLVLALLLTRLAEPEVAEPSAEGPELEEVEAAPEALEPTEPAAPARASALTEAPEAIAPAPATTTASPASPEVVPPAPDHVRIHPPRYRGTGLFIGAAALFGATALYQAGDIWLCGGCALGIIERLALAGSMGTATGGGVMRALHDSWYDTAFRRKRPPVRRYIIAGSVLVGLGGALGIANEMMWWGCWVGGTGPYAVELVDEWGPYTSCRYGAAQGLVDGASLLAGTGGALLGYGLTYQKRQRMFQRALIVASAPTLSVGRSGATLQLGGRF